MKKNQLIAAVASKADCSKEVATACYDAIIECIMESAKAGDKVDLSDFGKFEVKVRPARQGINPATGEKIEIAESKVLNFKPAKSIKESL
ncbi:MAG: HU family DNA-binding protein [Clostridia bacterium]|nr:HU family DNA-binding protein [Clostridia bacterium]